ncbi:hypothetical protein HU675_0019995 [Bradyrhizobium septentrionale]|uniref:hypothetical protein n=1 Tax=Bradyrhizobium septentrionale TaxID=1404411 RepID=UPI001596D801|nr:hypothetical protein [Bradyrhizobium septentrionale]UGY28866.1 hypothetical protein HU675_0019995 [Bradyrhizobium septentrionale]
MDSSRPTSLPDWLPPSIRELAQDPSLEILDPDNPERFQHTREILKRLIFDQRMQGVWKIICAPPPFVDEEFSDLRLSQQGRAAQKFFMSALFSSQLGAPTRRQIEEENANLRNVIENLVQYVTTLTDLGHEKEARLLTKVASQLENSIGESKAAFGASGKIIKFPWLIERERGDPTLRAFVGSMWQTTMSCFGTPLYGQIAVVANVVFHRDDVSREQVREMLREHTMRTTERSLMR